ncbi:low-density lipoprotein receptor-like isoform X2 [Mya arenaria]|uniref:low-density lipoprotein receptor-like isoform X2 n=1 Tax=Mya arenaria TaxID=6604 RepID=UPI0022DF39A8|nr:low-density lipoprotein receptor-like isoform X2 [Mya arenaria]
MSLVFGFCLVTAVRGHFVSPKAHTSPDHHQWPYGYHLPFHAFYDKESRCPGAFQCAGRNGACINTGKVCDGSMDCPGGEDETNCPPNCRHMGMTPCLDRKSCGRPCDGKHDCPDLSDEIFCPDSCACGPGMYQCKDGKKCIPVKLVCDGENDCPDFDDEMECSAECKCGEGFYMCEKDKKCIPVDQVCNNESDCMLGDDEANCPSGCKCNPGDYLCLGGSKCIPRDEFCEEQGDVDLSDADCDMGDDENTGFCNYPTQE